LTVAMTALELLVAFLQAYVFAILTCIYLNDAIHPGHWTARGISTHTSGRVADRSGNGTFETCRPVL